MQRMADSEQAEVHLCDLDEVVLCHIIAVLLDPVPLSQTCKALRHASQNSLCRQMWFHRWHTNTQITHRHISWAVLSWRGLAGCSAEQLARFLVHAMEHTAITTKQQHREQLHLVPEYIRSGNWVQYLRHVAPYAEHLLNSTAAVAHPSLLPCLFKDWRDSGSDKQSKAASSSSNSTVEDSPQAALQRQAGNSSDSSTEEHQQVLFSRTRTHERSTIRYKVHLPHSLRLPNYKHNLVQSALLAAASAGQVQSVQLLLQEMQDIYQEWRPSKLDILLAASESAVAAGRHACTDILFEHLTAVGAGEHEGSSEQYSYSKRESAAPCDQRLCLHHVLLSSRYIIVAAASSGDCDMLDRVLDQLLQFCQLVRQQLPDSLIAAGRRGHVEVMQRLLGVHLMSSRPLQLAAADAASRGWPQATLAALLQHIAAKHRYEMLQLLAKPIVIALQSRNTTASDAMLAVLQAEAEMDQPESLRDVLLMLANKGQVEHVSWVLKVAPTVLVKLGQTAVAAALEGGYPQVAQLILDAGAERPAAYKAAAKRGELVAAVRSRNLATVRELLTEVSLPLIWACESGGSSGGSVALAAAAAAGDAAAASANANSSNVTQCLLSLLKCAADAHAPMSVQLLQLLLPALPADRASERHSVLVQLSKYCMQTGACAELEAALSSAGRTVRAQANMLRFLASHFQLPDDDLYLRAPCKTCNSSSSSNAGADSSCCSSSHAAVAAAAAVPGPIVTALRVLRKPGCSDVLSRYVANPYLAAAHPVEYLGTTVHPSLPATFMPCLKGLTLLFMELSKLEQLPVAATVRDVALYKLMVRTVLQSCDRDLLLAFLVFMDKHGEALLKDLPQELEQSEQDWEEEDW